MSQIMMAAIAAGMIASSLFGTWLGSTFKQGQWDAAIVAQKEGQEKALQAAAEAIAKIEVKSETLIQPIRTEIRTNTVYRECKHSPDVLRNLNGLISESVGGGSVPKAK